MIEFTRTKLPDVLLIKLNRFTDDRGFFLESYEAGKFAEIGISEHFVQDNHSGSRGGTLRGLHYQLHHPQGKLIRVVIGEVFDVAVDLRRSSATFGRWVGVTLSAQECSELWVPKGFAHGFLVLSEWADIVYKVTDYYDPASERTLLWNDSMVDIEWPLSGTPLLSERDARGSPLNRAEVFA